MHFGFLWFINIFVLLSKWSVYANCVNFFFVTKNSIYQVKWVQGYPCIYKCQGWTQRYYTKNCSQWLYNIYLLHIYLITISSQKTWLSAIITPKPSFYTNILFNATWFGPCQSPSIAWSFGDTPFLSSMLHLWYMHADLHTTVQKKSLSLSFSL